MTWERFFLMVASLLATVALTACGDEGAGGADAGPDDVEYDFGDVSYDVDAGDAAIDAPAPDLCDAIDRATAVRVRSAAGGHQLHLFLYDADGNALDADYAGCLRLEEERLGELPHVAARATVDGSATLIVARWAPDDVEASRAFIDAYVEARPPHERIAVWAWSDELRQVVGATDDRERIQQRLDAVWTADDAPPMSAAAAATAAAEAWEKISEDVLVGPRDIIFVAPSLQLDALPDIDRDFVMDWWFAGAPGTDRVLTGAPAVAASELAVRFRTRAETGMAILAFCDDGQDLDLDLMVGDRRVRRLTIGDAAIEHAGLSCNLEQLLADGPSPMPVLDVRFTPEQRATYDEIAGRIDGDSEFEGLLRLQAHEETTPFRATFRGQSSLDCARKSWSMNLDGGDARHVLPGTGMDQFYLVSMCLDARYVNQINGDRLLARFGTWHITFGLVELRVDGGSQGVYLFIEEVDDALRNDASDARAVIRRRTDIDGKPPEAKWSFDDDDEAAIARYEAFLAGFESLSGDALLAALYEQMDFDQYLRWIAVMSLLENGDYVDEVFFVEEATVDSDHQLASYYTIQTWDPDDLFSPCHHNARFAIEDPSTMLYCSEAVLDHAVLTDPVVYARYVDVLAEVVAAITVDDFELLVNGTRDELLAWFADDEVRLAMVELIAANPDATDPDVFRAEIEQATATLVERFSARREALSAAIETFRSAP